LVAVAACAVAEDGESIHTIITTLPCFGGGGDELVPVPCTFALNAGESNKGAGFALGGASIGGGLGTQFGAGSFGGVVTTTTTQPLDADSEGGAASGEGEVEETVVDDADEEEEEEEAEEAFTCMSLIPLDDPDAQFACAQFIFNDNNRLCCTCVNPQAVSVGEKIQFSAESNCTSEQVVDDIKENVEFQRNVSGTEGACLKRCCTAEDSATALVFEVSVDIANQESETRTVCTEQTTKTGDDCHCTSTAIDDEEEVPPCEDNATVTILIVVFSVIVFVVLALAVYFIVKRDEDDDKV